jgi:hypothetical protein
LESIVSSGKVTQVLSADDLPSFAVVGNYLRRITSFLLSRKLYEDPDYFSIRGLEFGNLAGILQSSYQVMEKERDRFNSRNVSENCPIPESEL